jgi:hypothetical protein
MEDKRTQARSYMSRYVGDLTVEQINAIEDGIYRDAVAEIHPTENLTSHMRYYTSRVNTITANLRQDIQPCNTYLLQSIKDGIVLPENVGGLSSTEINPSSHQAKLIKAEATQLIYGKQVATTSLIKCRCGGETTYTEKQTRSADEAMTVTVTCQRCGKSWRD